MKSPLLGFQTARKISCKRASPSILSTLFIDIETFVQVLGKTSPWIRPDSSNQRLRRDSEAALKQELEWAAHLNLLSCVLPIPSTQNNANFARILNQVVIAFHTFFLNSKLKRDIDTPQLRLSTSSKELSRSHETLC